MKIKNMATQFSQCIIKYSLAGAMAIAPATLFAQNWAPVSGYADSADPDETGGGVIWEIAKDNDSLIYLSGIMLYIDSLLINGICSFDGENFDSLGIGYGCFGPIGGANTEMTYFNGLLWARDNCNYYGDEGTYRDYVTCWDGSQWFTPFAGYNDQGYMHMLGLFAVGDYLYINTAYGDTLNGYYTDGLLRYDGSEYVLLEGLHFDTGDICQIEDMALFQDKLYIAGNFFFDDVDGNFTQDIAYHDDEGWHRLSEPLLGDPYIFEMDVFQDELYICGQFEANAGNAGQGIMRWDGQQWHNLGLGVTTPNGWVNDIMATDSVLWVVGYFNEVGGIEAQKLAAWDGEKWCSTGSEIPSNYTNEIFSLNGEFYFSMYEIDGIQTGGLAKWIGGNMLVECGEPINAHELELNSIGLYPNPVSEILNINTREGHSELKIFDTLGQLLLTKNINTQSSINVSQLKAGIYLLSIESENGKVVKRFVKE